MVTNKALINTKGKRLLKMKNLQDREQNSTHTYAHACVHNEVNKSTLLIGKKRTQINKQTNVQIVL